MTIKISDITEKNQPGYKDVTNYKDSLEKRE